VTATERPPVAPAPPASAASPAVHRSTTRRLADLPQRRPLLVSAVGGVLLGLSWPPRGWWWAAVIGMVLAAAALVGHGWRRRLLIGEMAGTGFFGIGLLYTWGHVPIEVLAVEAVAAAVLAGFVALATVLAPSGPAMVAGLPAALVVMAAVQSRWPVGGLPGIGFAIGQVEGPLLAAARIGGELAVVGALGLVGAGGGWWWRRPRHRRPAYLALAAAVLLVAGGAVVEPGRTVREVDVALVQGGGARGVDAISTDDFYELQVRAAATVDDPVDLVVLPEGVAHVRSPVAETERGRVLGELARRLDATVLAGVITSNDDATFRNSAYVWGPDGHVTVHYDKRHGVPFGEYIPARDLLDRFFDLSLTPSDIDVGERSGVIATPAADLGVVISFEVFFSRLVNETVDAGAELVVVPSNASSFPTDLAAAVELAASRLRAIESGRWLVQVTPTGYSAVVDHHGDIRAATGISDDRVVLVRAAELRTGSTPFVRLGEWPLAALAVVALLLAWTTSRRPATVDARRSADVDA
jgi:apolipoprotein N-acyltransferase